MGEAGSPTSRPGQVARVGVYPGTFDPPTVAHLAIAQAAQQQCGLVRVDLTLSRVPLGKQGRTVAPLGDRVAVLREVAATRPWLGVRVSDQRLVADLAAGYDVVVVGADKWLQLLDPAWYGGSPAARDAALARLPEIAVAPRAGVSLAVASLPGRVTVLDLPAGLTEVSSSRARAGEPALMLDEARAYDVRTGVWSGVRANGR